MREEWVDVELGRLFTIVTGNTPSKKDTSNYGKDIPFIKPPELTNEVISRASEYLSLKGASSARLLPVNSVLVTCIGNLGRIGINTKPIACNQQINAIKPVDGIEPKFTFYQAQSHGFRNQLERLSTSTTVALVNKGNFETIQFIVAPLPEQRAIVSRIEELFSAVDSGVDSLRQAQAQLKVYRQAVLKKAFENIESKLPLAELGDWAGGGTPSTSNEAYWEGGTIPWVSSKDVKVKDLFDTERHITELAIENSSTKWIPQDSLIFVMRSGILRRLFPISIARAPMCVNQDILTLSLKSDYNPEYVFWFLTGNESSIRNGCSKDGTTVESIDGNKLKAFMIPVCSPKEQHQIVQEIEKRLSVCDSLEAAITDSLRKAEALRQSILKKAFAGQLLTEAELAACRQEKDWEPAGVLLERIKKEKNGKKK
jgi:type I restriction enzyme, S subunit